ncbi:MAG TPA: hypothetical protein VGY55_09375 [Pirellulales bacterium]|jgi:hypothetical protein|nr:hypothetical protein [Pirellulales bacterium]
MIRLAMLAVLTSLWIARIGAAVEPPKENTPLVTDLNQSAPPVINDDDSAPTIAKKAFDAQGGKQTRDRWKRGYAKYKTPQNVFGQNLDVTIEDTFDFPNNEKRIVYTGLPGEDATITFVTIGGTCWIKAGNKETFSTPIQRPQTEHAFASLCAIPADASKDAKLSKLEDGKIDDRAMAHIRVESEKNGTVEWLVDKQTGLLSGTRKFGRMPGSDKVSSLEVNFADYRRVQGSMVPMKVTGYQDAKKTINLTIIALKFLDKIPPETFTKP